MKAKYIILGIVVGIVLTVAYFRAFLPIQNFARQEVLLGDVYQPLDYMLQDIARDYDQGDAKLAEAKTRLLQQRWSECLHGGPAPERFANEIVLLKATTQPTH
jgi:hypothetical protein